MMSIFTPVGILLTVVIIALLISLVVMLRISTKVTNNNARLIDEMAQLSQSARRQEEPQKLGTAESTATAQQNGDQFSLFDRQMDEHRLYCQPDIDLKTTSLTLGLTQRSILQLLKDSEGSPTFTEYIAHKRMTYASQLLKEKPNWNIDAIGREAGIMSDATFRRLFRKHFGMSPSEYREQNRSVIIIH